MLLTLALEYPDTVQFEYLRRWRRVALFPTDGCAHVTPLRMGYAAIANTSLYTAPCSESRSGRSSRAGLAQDQFCTAGSGVYREMSADADAAMKKAEKLLRPSMMSMRLKPAWDDAMPLFEQAALQYKVIR